jgi:hypothetical protein
VASGGRGLRFAQITGTFAEPTWLGSYLLSALVFFGILILNGKGHEVLFASPLWNRLGLITMFLAFGFALSLGPYVSLLATIVVMYMIRRLDLRNVTKYILGSVIIMYVGANLVSFLGIDFLGVLYHRVSDFFLAVVFRIGAGGSYSTRLARSIEALKVWWANPILGVGLNNTKFHTPAIYNLVNNGWVELMSDTGVLGLATMLMVFWCVLYRLDRFSKKIGSCSWRYYLVVGLFFVLISDIVDTFITFNWTHPIRWFTLSLANLILVFMQTELRMSGGAISKDDKP